MIVQSVKRLCKVMPSLGECLNNFLQDLFHVLASVVSAAVVMVGVVVVVSVGTSRFSPQPDALESKRELQRREVVVVARSREAVKSRSTRKRLSGMAESRSVGHRKPFVV